MCIQKLSGGRVLRLDRIYLPAIVAIGLSGLCPVAHAMQFEPAIGAGLAYSDNVNLTAVNEQDDIVAIGYLGGSLIEKDGPLRGEAISSFAYESYLDNTVDDQRYFKLNSSAVWEQVRGRLFWNVSDFFSQAKIDSLQADRTSNIQNTNTFAFGPSIHLQPSGAHRIVVSPQYRNFYYQNSDANNQQYELSANWLYQMRPTLQVGLGAGVDKVDYDNEQLNPGTVSRNVHTVLVHTGARTSYTVNLGATHVSRDRSASTRGFTGDVTWLRELTGHSSLRFYLASQLTNTSSSLLDSELNPDNGSSGSEQISSDVIRDNTMSIVYRRTGHRLETTIRGQVQVVDYQQSPSDRSSYHLNAGLGYKVAPLVSSGVNLDYVHLKEDLSNRTDKEFRISGTVSYHLSRKLRTELAVRYQDKSSNLAAAEYNEAAVFIGLIWGPGSVPRTGIM